MFCIRRHIQFLAGVAMIATSLPVGAGEESIARSLAVPDRNGRTTDAGRQRHKTPARRIAPSAAVSRQQIDVAKPSHARATTAPAPTESRRSTRNKATRSQPSPVASRLARFQPEPRGDYGAPMPIKPKAQERSKPATLNGDGTAYGVCPSCATQDDPGDVCCEAQEECDNDSDCGCEEDRCNEAIASECDEEEQSVEITVYCPSDTVITINHAPTLASGTRRQFRAKVDDPEGTYLFLIEAKRRSKSNSDAAPIRLDLSAGDVCELIMIGGQLSKVERATNSVPPAPAP